MRVKAFGPYSDLHILQEKINDWFSAESIENEFKEIISSHFAMCSAAEKPYMHSALIFFEVHSYDNDGVSLA